MNNTANSLRGGDGDVPRPTLLKEESASIRRDGLRLNGRLQQFRRSGSPRALGPPEPTPGAQEFQDSVSSKGALGWLQQVNELSQLPLKVILKVFAYGIGTVLDGVRYGFIECGPTVQCRDGR